MELTLNFVDEIDPVAIYAAIVATAILVWEVIKWFRSGPRLTGRTQPNTIVVGGFPEDKDTYVFVEVRNVGDRRTTIKGVYLIGYESFWHLLRRRGKFNAMVVHEDPAYPLPFVLEDGRVFHSKLTQTDEIVELSRSLKLFVVVGDSSNRRDLHLRVKPIREDKAQGD